jgi:1-acyl-sn-glycerol-3-phosphate acyltransferase
VAHDRPEPQETPGDLAPMKAQVYKDARPKEYFDRFHERSRTREPDWVY